MFLRCSEILSVVQSNNLAIAFCVSQNVSSLNITLTNSLPFSSLYNNISPRFATSLFILVSLLIPFRQSCRIGYNVRDPLAKRIGSLRSDYRTTCFSSSCCSSHATRIFRSSKKLNRVVFDIFHILSLHNYMNDAISILYISIIKILFTDNIVHRFVHHCKRQKIWQRRKRNLLCLTVLTALPPCVPALPARQHGGD